MALIAGSPETAYVPSPYQTSKHSVPELILGKLAKSRWLIAYAIAAEHCQANQRKRRLQMLRLPTRGAKHIASRSSEV